MLFRWMLASGLFVWCVVAATAAPRPDRTYPVDEPFSVQADRVVQGDPQAFPKVGVALSATRLQSSYFDSDREWTLTADLSGLARLSAPQTPLLAALWNLSLEEALKNVITTGPQAGGFSAGAQWPGVWTRDVSYAAHLSLAWLFPAQVEASLRAKVDRLGRIIQDTGTGGSWPVSTDRVVWALAARELYRATGNRDWLGWAYQVLAKTADLDRQNVYDPLTGLYFGETSFLDWREQSYPVWMQSADIYQSPAVGTNVVHQQELATLASFATELGRPPEEALKWSNRANDLADAIRAGLFDARQGWYAIYRYPVLAGASLSDRSDCLGNALAVLSGVARDQARLVVQSLPVVTFGPPVLYPQFAQTGPYHNKSIWPFVTAYFGWAAQSAGEPGIAVRALESNVRVGALFLTNKENFVFDTGHPVGTAVNSDRQLWSVAGQLAGLLRTVFGFSPDDTGVEFHPVVPAWVKGELTLSGLKWRGSTLTLKVLGTGSQVASMSLDGIEVPANTRLASHLTGVHVVTLKMRGDEVELPSTTTTTTAKGPWDAYALQIVSTPERTLKWKTRAGVAVSRVYHNGQLYAETPLNTVSLPPATEGPLLDWWTVRTYNDAGWAATWAEPLLASPQRVLFEFPDVELDARVRTGTAQTLNLPLAATWYIRWRYSNTNGPVNTDNKAALRTLWIDKQRIGTVVMPQRGNKASDKGWTNGFPVTLTPGPHLVELTLEPGNENMNIETNGAWVDALEAWPLQETP